jgi:hypothetical protein
MKAQLTKQCCNSNPKHGTQIDWVNSLLHNLKERPRAQKKNLYGLTIYSITFSMKHAPCSLVHVAAMH